MSGEQRSSGRLRGKVAVVTGAAHGIGSATACRFVGEGARVVLVDVSQRGVDMLAEELGDAATGLRCDVSCSPGSPGGDGIAAAVTTAVDQFGGLDILVNNAAVGAAGRVEELDPTDWDRVLAVNLGGVLHGIRAATPAMRERGGGAIVNLSSVVAQHAAPGVAAYAVSKAGVEALTRCAALELRTDRIRVNAIAPGMIRTRAADASAPFLAETLGGDAQAYVARRQGRWGEPDEVAAVTTHLACDEASFTTGQVYVLDNGATALP